MFKDIFFSRSWHTSSLLKRPVRLGVGGLIPDPSVLPIRRPEHALPLLLLLPGVVVKTGSVLLLLSFLLLPSCPLHLSGSFLKLLPFSCLPIAKGNPPCRQGRPVPKSRACQPFWNSLARRVYQAPCAVLSPPWMENSSFHSAVPWNGRQGGLGRWDSIRCFSGRPPPGPRGCPRQVDTWGGTAGTDGIRLTPEALAPGTAGQLKSATWQSPERGFTMQIQTPSCICGQITPPGSPGRQWLQHSGRGKVGGSQSAAAKNTPPPPRRRRPGPGLQPQPPDARRAAGWLSRGSPAGLGPLVLRSPGGGSGRAGGRAPTLGVSLLPCKEGCSGPSPPDRSDARPSPCPPPATASLPRAGGEARRSLSRPPGSPPPAILPFPPRRPHSGTHPSTLPGAATPPPPPPPPSPGRSGE